MSYNPDIHHRRSIRLRNYDYTRAGAYFVTICVQHRECLFGGITNGVMRLNDAGRMTEKWFAELENKFHEIECDEFVCMPNHVHFIVVNVGADLRVRPDIPRVRVRPPNMQPSRQVQPGQTHRSAPTGTSLSDVVQWFKTMTTNEYIRGVKQNGWQPFPGKLWQRNYWDHVIRNETELYRIRQYIRNNPSRWQEDALHPDQPPFPGETREPSPAYGHESYEVWMV
ncbi:MAG: transposase [Candidatus Electrothrix sp. YB6]